MRRLGTRFRISATSLSPSPRATPVGPDRARFLPQIAQTCTRLGEMVYQAVLGRQVAACLGGDHSIAVGTVAGLARARREKGEKIGLIWIDAHADMNSPDSSPSGNVHGMPLACCLGQGPSELTDIFDFAPKVDPRNVAIIGLRDVDRTEVPHVRGAGVAAFTMREIDERGLRSVMTEAIECVSEGTAGIPCVVRYGRGGSDVKRRVSARRCGAD